MREDNLFEFNFNFGDDKTIEEAPLKTKQHTRRKNVLLERSYQHIYKRAHSELQLLNSLDDKKLKKGYSYSYITSGDVDALSFLMLAMRTYKELDYLLVSTWCISNEDILYLFELIEQKKIKRLDIYVGEIFPSSYKVEWKLIKELYEKHQCGHIKVFKNHSKIMAGIIGGNGFSIQSSANINTNPRTEQACIINNLESALFYKDYFDGIISFE